MRTINLLAAALVACTAFSSSAAEPNWNAVEQALGKSGQLMPGDVFRIGMPRTDLRITVKGIPVKAGFALGSYAAFRQVADDAMVMGDLVLLDQEIPAVMSGLFANGLEVTAVHNHLNEMSPHVMYMHYEGRGDAVQLARGLRQALAASATPLGGSPSGPAPAGGPTLDTKRIERALGRTGQHLWQVEREETLPDIVVTGSILPGKPLAALQDKLNDTDVAPDVRTRVHVPILHTQHVEGRLVVDIFDVRTHQPAWHGWATRTLSTSDRKDPQPAIRSALTAILANFPPG